MKRAQARLGRRGGEWSHWYPYEGAGKRAVTDYCSLMTTCSIRHVAFLALALFGVNRMLVIIFAGRATNEFERVRQRGQNREEIFARRLGTARQIHDECLAAN